LAQQVLKLLNGQERREFLEFLKDLASPCFLLFPGYLDFQDFLVPQYYPKYQESRLDLWHQLHRDRH